MNIKPVPDNQGSRPELPRRKPESQKGKGEEKIGKVKIPFENFLKDAIEKGKPDQEK